MPHRPVPLRAWCIYGATLAGCVAAVLHYRFTVEGADEVVGPLYWECTGVLVLASVVTTRFGGVTRGYSTSWNATTAAISSLVMMALLLWITPSAQPHFDLPSLMYFGMMVLAWFAPLAIVQVILGWLVARPDASSDVMDSGFALEDEPTWRQGIAAALASIEDGSARKLDAAERQCVSELALDLCRDADVPAEIAALGARLRSALASDAGRRRIAKLLAAGLRIRIPGADPYRGRASASP